MATYLTNSQSRAIIDALDGREKHALELILDGRYEEIRLAVPEHQRPLLSKYGLALKGDANARPPEELSALLESPQDALPIIRAYYLHDYYLQDLITGYLGTNISELHYRGYGDDIERLGELMGIQNPEEYVERSWREAINNAPSLNVSVEDVRRELQDVFLSVENVGYPPVCRTHGEAEEAVRDICDGLAQIVSEHLAPKGRII